jgi:hypothetical protein
MTRTFAIWVTPGDQLIRRAPVRHEFHATDAEHASKQAIAKFPGCTFGIARDVTPPGYSVATWVDSQQGFAAVSGFGLLPT